MQPVEIGLSIVADTMAHLLPAKFDGVVPRLLLLANGMQETGFTTRKQIGGGPGRSYWQFEQGGGVNGVLTNPSTRSYARAFCGLCAVAPVASDVYASFGLSQGDRLACAFARMLLWADPWQLPAQGDVRGAFGYYVRNWRPGAYARGNATERAEIEERFANNYAIARAAMTGGKQP